MRKKILILSIFILVLFSAISAKAQFLGQLQTAQTMKAGTYNLGGYLGVYEDGFSVFGEFRFGMGKYLDGGFKLGIIDLDMEGKFKDSQTGFTFGADIKYQTLETDLGDPVDLSFGLGMELFSADDCDIFSLGGNIIASRDIRLQSGKSVSPYGRLNLRYERTSWEWNYSDKHSDSDSDFDIGINLGTHFELSSEFTLSAELQIDDQIGFIGGIAFWIY